MNTLVKNHKSTVVIPFLFATSALFAASQIEAKEFDVQAFLSKTYITIGVGYKVQEQSVYFRDLDLDGEWYKMDKAPTARFEIYYQYSKNIRIGISHHSQYSVGAPFNDLPEYHKTEIFIDYTFSLGG